MRPQQKQVDETTKSTTLTFSELVASLPKRTDLHIARKVWHASAGLIAIALILSGISHPVLTLIFGALFSITVFTEFLRLRNPAINEVCIRVMSPFIRTHEVCATSGMPYYAASCFIAVVIFPTPIAILSILYLAFGDPIASAVGILTRKKSITIVQGKSFQGIAAAYVVCAVITWLFLRTYNVHGLDLIRLSFLGGFAGSIPELIPLEIDDNFTIPLVSGLILWVGFNLIPVI